ncbi:lamina-associated polypeptide 2, isoforms beta/delta/epsilon/gamma [Cricetulus griseus]|uniref:Lamina-associated polypeptide 2, isoforms beta/delta/epsilon/gamma n=1 Tax=Cricetulus griseus TaxID=10029 RepID=A0A061INA9_CRIGR|nr:lamina-associated polypeptide 2, isoforms beta/delta/epsilon/gamma [Cricetulus griseus]
MPEFLEDPSVLTKDRLKSELVANNVALPAGEQRKDVYVQLYLQHLTARNRPSLSAGANSKGPPDFSSDEEREPTPVLGSGTSTGRGRAAVGRKATKKTDKLRPEDKDDLDVTELSNEDLLEQLVRYGVNPGPIVGTTRKLYEKKLLKLREQGTESRSSTPLPTVSSSAENARQNGSNDSDRYSDNDEGKKKEHKKVKSTRDFVPFSELASASSGGFFQGISFPEISTRPPLGRTELQAAKKVHTSKGDPPREPFTDTALPRRGQVQKVAPGRNVFIPSESTYDRYVEKSSSSSSQHELAARLASAAASPSRIRETTTTYCKDTVENIYRGGKSRTRPSCTEGSDVSDQSILSSEREVLQESERSQVISPPLAREIRDYVNFLLVQGGVGSLPGISNSVPTLDVENICKRFGQSNRQDFESLSPPRTIPRLSETPPKEGGSGSHVAFQNVPESEHMSSFAKSVVSHSLTTLGIEMSEQPQHDKIDASEPSFPLHDSILKVIEEEWQQTDRQLPSLACKYPVSSSEATRILSVPAVDDEILGLVSETTPRAAIQASSTESCDKHLDLALCRSYEAAASALQIAAHTAFVAKSLQANISQAAQAISADPSRAPQALEILSRSYDAASYLCDAAFDEVRMSAYAMGSSTVGRRHLWLKDYSKIELKLEKREPLKGRAKTPVTLKQRRIEHNQSYSQAGVTDTEWTSGPSKGGSLQALTRESTRGPRRTPRKRVETSQHFRIDGAVISESTPIAETIKASSNESLVVNRFTGNFKHASSILPITEFSDISRRTPKKPLPRAEVGEKTEERRVERDILKEMFPYEASTPTGISASCRRPIKGAAGRPLEFSDFRMEESFSSKYVPKYVPLADVKSEKTKKGRSIPMWIKMLLFVVVAVFLFLVYQAMETNQGNPFTNFLQDSKISN